MRVLSCPSAYDIGQLLVADAPLVTHFVALLCSRVQCILFSVLSARFHFDLADMRAGLDIRTALSAYFVANYCEQQLD